MIKITIQFIAILMLAFSSSAFSMEEIMYGSVCIAPITIPNSNDVTLSNPSGGNREFNFSIQIDEREKVELGFNNNFELVGLPLDTRHIVTIRNNINIIESFWFSFDQYSSDELCLWFNPIYETWSLWEHNDSEHICRCQDQMTTVITGSSADTFYLSPFDIVLLMDKVKQDDMEAAERLSMYYSMTERDFDKSTELLRMIAKSAGDSRVQHNLAGRLTRSSGLEERKEGVYWYEASAKQGYEDSQFMLAVLYERGEIVEQDYCKAKYWYEKAARSGNWSSLLKMSEFSEDGKCEDKNKVEAYIWLLLAKNYMGPKNSIRKSTNEKIAIFEKQLSESERKHAKNKYEELQKNIEE
jgi:hypothetical protein